MSPPYHRKVGSSNGAQLGRRDHIPADAPTVKKMSLRRVTPAAGDYNADYDRGGAYWGGLDNSPLFCAWGDSDTEQAVIYVRADHRETARHIVLRKFPNARIR